MKGGDKMLDNFDVEFEDYIIFHRGIKNFYIEDDTSANPKHLHVIYQDGTDQDLGNPYGDYVSVAQESASLASQYAKGKTITVTEEGVVEETDVEQGNPGYHDNAKYYADQSRSSSLNAELWAVGTMTGEEGSDINNSRYWSNESRTRAALAVQAQQSADASKEAAALSAQSAAASAAAANSAAAQGVETAIAEIATSLVYAGTCNTGASSAKKIISNVTPELPELTEGLLLLVDFTVCNTATSNVKLAFSNEDTGVNVYSLLRNVPAEHLYGNCLFVYKNSVWHLIASEHATNKIIYSETSAPSSPYKGMIWLKKKPTT